MEENESRNGKKSRVKDKYMEEKESKEVESRRLRKGRKEGGIGR